MGRNHKKKQSKSKPSDSKKREKSKSPDSEKIEETTENVVSTLSPVSEDDMKSDTLSAEPHVSVEDQINIDNVLRTLNVTPERSTEPALVIEKSEEAEVASPGISEEEDRNHEVKNNEVDLHPLLPTEIGVRKSSLQLEPSKPNVATSDDGTSFKSKAWCKKDEEVDFSRIILVDSYEKNFYEFLCAIDPEFRFAAGIGPCETFDSEGVKKLFEKMKEQEFENAWPFSKTFSVHSSEEFRILFSEIMEWIKLSLKLACAERGYEYMCGKRKIQKLSKVWGTHLGNRLEQKIDPVLELKTINAILKEVKEAMESLEIDYKDDRFWTEVEDIFEVVLPALETFDSQLLSEKRINDNLATITGRLEHGFMITDAEVDEMLETSLAEEGFGDFPMTALRHLGLFTTSKQLKMIFDQLSKMSTCTDIRVKQSGMQAITHILSQITEEQAMELRDELSDKPKPLFEKMFGFDPNTFDPLKGGLKRTHYLKIFFTALGEPSPKEENYFTARQLIPPLLCFYLIFNPLEINTVIYKIVSCIPHHAECANLDYDRRALVEGLLLLPFSLRERLQVGPEFMKGEITENTESMYFLIKQAIKSQREDFGNHLAQAIQAGGKSQFISFERVVRMCMGFVENGEHQKMSVETIQLLRRRSFKHIGLPKELFEDLILLALSKYTIPETKFNEKKYSFIEDIFKMVEEFENECELKLDEEMIVDKWMNMSIPWFSVVYISVKFQTLNFPSLRDKIKFPWLSSEVWDEESKAEPEINKYASLAKVSTAWPECSDLNVIKTTIERYVPSSISRQELYQEMKKYVQVFSIGDFWKKNLLNRYDELIKLSCGGDEKKDSQKEDDLKSESEVPGSKKVTDGSLGHEDFCMEYDEEEWKRFPEPVKNEVIRQRELRKQLEEQQLEQQQ